MSLISTSICARLVASCSNVAVARCAEEESRGASEVDRDELCRVPADVENVKDLEADAAGGDGSGADVRVLVEEEGMLRESWRSLRKVRELLVEGRVTGHFGPAESPRLVCRRSKRVRRELDKASFQDIDELARQLRQSRLHVNLCLLVLSLDVSLLPLHFVLLCFLPQGRSSGNRRRDVERYFCQ